jgi:uncharacterized membrane protein
VLIQLGVLRYAYMRLGISSGAALLLLLASLIGSYFNIPVAYLPEQRVLAHQEIDYFGMRYVVPFVAQWPGTLIAVNVGGAVIPTMMSIYLLAKNRLWVNAALATASSISCNSTLAGGDRMQFDRLKRREFITLA